LSLETNHGGRNKSASEITGPCKRTCLQGDQNLGSKSKTTTGVGVGKRHNGSSREIQGGKSRKQGKNGSGITTTRERHGREFSDRVGPPYEVSSRR